MVDRAGFEPATFRFFFASMRTRRSLAPFQQFRAYQAELPALGPLENLHAFKRLSEPIRESQFKSQSILSAIHIIKKEADYLRSTSDLAAQD